MYTQYVCVCGEGVGRGVKLAEIIFKLSPNLTLCILTHKVQNKGHKDGLNSSQALLFYV